MSTHTTLGPEPAIGAEIGLTRWELEGEREAEWVPYRVTGYYTGRDLNNWWLDVDGEHHTYPRTVWELDMAAPKLSKPTPAMEREAYATATERDSDTCQRCRRNCGPSNRDHRKDRSVGGRTEPANLQILGGSGTTGCHGWKTANPEAALEEGWAVPGYADPAEWPARRWVAIADRGTERLAWVLYHQDGTYEEIDILDAFDRMGRLA